MVWNSREASRGFTLGDARSFWRLTSKIPPLGSMLNFDADVKKMNARHQCENRFSLQRPECEFPMCFPADVRAGMHCTQGNTRNISEGGPLECVDEDYTTWNLSAHHTVRGKPDGVLGL